MTAMRPEDEALRLAQGGRPGSNVPASPDRFTLMDSIRALRGLPPRDLLYSHVTAREVRDALPDTVWDAYLKVAVERNPWDRAVSQYWWDRAGRAGFPSFSVWLSKRARRGRHKISNWDIYAIGDRPVADRILRYENLEADFRALGEEIGVPDLALPDVKAKSGGRTDRRPYREIFSAADSRLVSRICEREFELLGYGF